MQNKVDPTSSKHNRLMRLGVNQLDQLVLTLFFRAQRRMRRRVKRNQIVNAVELSRRAIDRTKRRATTLGGTTGMLGLVGLPVDVLGMLYLQLELLVEVAAIYDVDLQGEGARSELLNLFASSSGLGLVGRPGTLALGKLAAMLLARGGFSRLSRAVPLISAPISAAINRRHVEAVGEAAIRHHESWPAKK